MQSFMKNIQRNKGIWIQMSPYLKGICHRIALGEDRQNIIRKNGIYQRLRIVNPNEVNKERIYGIIMLDGRELLADKLTYEELKDRHLQREVEVLRETRENNAWVTLAHGNSKTNQIIEYDNLWPKMIFEQGNKNSCLQRSMCSVLMYIRKSRDVKAEF